MATGGLSGITIENNFPQTQEQFQTLMNYMKAELSSPLELTVNVVKMQEQLQKVSEDLTKLKDQMSDSTTDQSLINPDATKKATDEMGESLDAIKEKLHSMEDVVSVKFNSSSINQISDEVDVAIKNMETFTATVVTTSGAVEKLTYEMKGMANADTPLYTQTGIKGVTDKSQSEEMTQENALVERENELRDQTLSLMTQITTAQGDLAKAEQQSNAPLVADIDLRKQALELQMQQIDSNSIASNQAVNSILGQQKTCQEDISTILAKIQGQNDAIGESIDAQNAKFQVLKASELQAMDIKFGDNLNSNAIDEIIEKLQVLNNTVFETQADWKTASDSINMDILEVRDNAKLLVDSMEEVDESGGVMGTMMSNIFKFGSWTIAATAIFGVVNAVKSAISTAVTMDSTLARLQYTLSSSTTSFTDLKTDIQQTAIALGSSVDTVETAVKIYANLGDTASNAMAKTQSAIELSNVSGLDITSTANAINAVINQFGLASQDAETTSEHIANSLVAIASNMSVDFGTAVTDITSGIQLVGSVASSVGKMSSDAMEAMLGAIVEDTRLSGDTIATGLLYFEPLVA
jgi:hypothetical protein